jgi:predicted nuclease of restriction endonuclease-like (RecB) superfamily
MTRKFGWSKNVLIHQIENQTYEKTLLSQTNFDETVPAEIRNQAKLAVKDEYTFDFLELADEYKERELESAILSKIEKFLLEIFQKKTKGRKTKGRVFILHVMSRMKTIPLFCK